MGHENVPEKEKKENIKMKDFIYKNLLSFYLLKTIRKGGFFMANVFYGLIFN